MRIFIISLFVTFGLALTSCSGGPNALSSLPNQDLGDNGDGGGGTIGDGEDLISKDLTVCPTLSFEGMQRPPNFDTLTLNAFVAALSISSSFEGDEGWKNITNNFDGQGLSLGLLNQTLGTGSLEPLLLDMMENHNAEMRSFFTTADANSLENMLLNWKQASGLSTTQSYEEGPLSPLDIDNRIHPFGAPENSAVTWAKQNLYTDSAGLRFKPVWKTELQNLAGSVSYRNIQFDTAAQSLHQKAARYYRDFGFHLLKSYLFLFDIIVQNGGFYQANITDYQNFIAANPNATEDQKLQALLTSRLKQVLSQYREDVRARKQSIIDGHGVVHGSSRNYEREYCFQRNQDL